MLTDDYSDYVLALNTIYVESAKLSVIIIGHIAPSIISSSSALEEEESPTASTEEEG